MRALVIHVLSLKSQFCSGFDPEAVRKEDVGVKNSNEGEGDVCEDDSVEILNDSTEDVKEEELKEEDGDDIWDNMVIILQLYHPAMFINFRLAGGD